MSKLRQVVFLFAFTAALIPLSFGGVRAQDFEAKIKIASRTASVEGRFLDAVPASGARNFSFLRSYINIENLGERVSDVDLRDGNMRPVEARRLVAGEYLAGGDFRSWSYRMNLQPGNNPSALAHVSWLSAGQGILMLADLLPQFDGKSSARITLELPAGWRVLTVEKRLGDNIFAVESIEDAVFYIGGEWREREFASGGTRINLALSGEWKFTDDEAAQMIGQIFAYYEKLFGARPSERVQIALARFPQEAGFGRWEAETRGASVTIFSADMPFSTQSAQKLHEQLRHEIFHLWMPNALNLSGNYDWFYEGFALYQSLRAALAVNRIRFEDFLDTLSRAYNIDSAQGRRINLIDASSVRWTGANTQVYARGMLVAFLTDLRLLQTSKGRRSIEDLLREVYRKHRAGGPRVDGNTAILGILESYAELRPVVERYIRGAGKIEWQTDLEAAGIEAKTENLSVKLSVKPKPNGRQKDLLDKLGYNNWRKRSELSK